MEKAEVFVVLFCLLQVLCVSRSTSNVSRGYVFTAPKRLLAGEAENGCLSLHNLEPPAHVSLELLSPLEEEVLASTNTVIKTGTEACLELMVPSTKYSSGRLRLKMKLDKHPQHLVEAEKEVYIEHDSLITFVETDKPVYKPSQDVNIRILTLKHDLKPWRKPIPKIWIENPSEVRVAQWTNVSAESGMAQLTFPLSPEASSGAWRIKVEKKKSYPQLIHTTLFEVKKYVLPRFQVTIKSPGYILADAENVTWNICAKYSYGKPVKGTLLLKSTPQTPSWRRTLNLPEIHYETELDSPDGCSEFVLSGTVLGLAHWKVAPNNIVLIANFTEAGTGVVETTISRTLVMHQALKLEFVPYTPKYFKLGLPYHGKLRVLHQDDTPAPNEKIQLCLRVRGKHEWVRVVVECRNFTSSTDGFIDFIVPPPHRNIVVLSFIATGIEYPTKYYSPDKRWRVFMDQPSAYIDVNPWFSPSDSYLAVARGSQPIVCGEKYSFNVMYTMPANAKTNESIAFHYSINSKGDLLIYGHVKHKPSRDTVLNYSEFRNLLGTVESPTNKTDQGSVAHRFPLSVKVTPSMAPVSELLLYYVRPDGEIVATTYTIEVGHCFENKVKTAWHTDVQSPGTSTQYHIEAAPWSLCSVSAVDKSTLFLGGSKSNLVDADQTFDQLKRFHPDPEIRNIWSWTHCQRSTPTDGTGEEIDHLPSPAFEAPPAWRIISRRRRTSIYHGAVHYVDAIQAFDDFGAIVSSDLILETRPCPQFLSTIHSGLELKLAWKEMDEPDRMFKTVKSMPIAFPLINFAVPATTMQGPELGYVDQLIDQSATLRSYFPETWLWELVPTGKEGKVTIERNLPHTITDWVGHTVCISPTHGLGIAPPTTITAFQPFFLDYNLPYSVKRGEMLRMKVSLFNYMQHSLPVKIELQEAPGLDLHLSHATASFCVKPRDSIVHEYVLRPRVLGEINITVSAAIDPEYAEPCGPETLIYTRDVIVKPILVLPEGFPVDVTKSAFICPKDFNDDSMITWNLELPEDLVPESGRAYVTLIGDILGPALENLENLVRLPMGCGEQNMILFVPNIHVIGYLDAVGIDNPELRAKAIKNMQKGYQREQMYRHPDGSYSAFGPESSEVGSSIWLTAFVVKSFAQARSLILIDERDLKHSVKWIIKKQLENGCFPLVGRVFHKDMKGGLQDSDSSSSALTAYILIALLESGVPLTASLINNALYCLEKGMASSDNSPYTAALSTYALAVLEHPKANTSMKMLMERATRHHDLLWWEDKSKPSTGLSIEMTAYAILSLVKLGGESNMVEALKAVRWMSKQRNAEGGFTSTQDTVLGLEALTKYAASMNTNSTDLSVLVTAGYVDHVYWMNNDNRMILTQIRLPVLPTVVEIFAEGEGCVLVQSNMKYNVAHATGSEAFDLSVAAASVALVDECAMQRITICTRYKMADEESNMALLEVGMISGYVPDRASLHSLLQDAATKVKRFEEDRDIVTLYFDKLTGQKTCISFTVTRENVVDRLEPANVKLYDYYQQELTISSSYSFAQTCSSADSTDEHSVPYPMPVEVKVTHVKDQTTERPAEEPETSKVLEKSSKTASKESAAKNNKTGVAVPEAAGAPGQKPPSAKASDMAEKLRNRIASRRGMARERTEKMRVVAGAASTGDDVPFVGNDSFKTHGEDLDSVANVRTTNDNSIAAENPEGPEIPENPEAPQVESGSGSTPDEADINLNPVFDRIDPNTDFSVSSEDRKDPRGPRDPQEPQEPLNPSFVVVSHELDTPDGLEGPLPVYVKSDGSETANPTTPETTEAKLDSTVATEDAQATMTVIECFSPLTEAPGASKEPPSCPSCLPFLPSFNDSNFCSAQRVVKVAVRRARRVRLLMDLRPFEEPKRLYSTVTFLVDPECVCKPLDSLGRLALVVNMDKDFVSTERHYTQKLDDSFHVYGLPLAEGDLSTMMSQWRSACATTPADQSASTDPPSGS